MRRSRSPDGVLGVWLGLGSVHFGLRRLHNMHSNRETPERLRWTRRLCVRGTFWTGGAWYRALLSKTQANAVYVAD
jgi:hypothetical protein